MSFHYEDEADIEQILTLGLCVLRRHLPVKAKYIWTDIGMNAMFFIINQVIQATRDCKFSSTETKEWAQTALRFIVPRLEAAPEAIERKLREE